MAVGANVVGLGGAVDASLADGAPTHPASVTSSHTPRAALTV
ncbi:MAG: hypothetical protein ACOH1U_07980 [Rhodoglobus sp.]